MGSVVTGISQTGEVGDLEQRLKQAALSIDRIQVISPDDSTQGTATRGLANPGYIAGGMETGTGVPGITNTTSNVLGRQYFRNESLADRLGDLEIPDDQVDNYLDALSAGRSVIAYFARPDNVDQVTGIFKDCGLARVRTY